MRTENGQIKDMMDGTELGDAASVGQASSVHDAGILTVKKPDYVHKTTSNGSGQAVFYLTTDGTSGGTPIYSTVKTVHIHVNTNSSNVIPAYSLAGVTLTISLTQQTFNTTNVLITLLGALTGAVTSVSYPAAGSGHVIEVRVTGI